MTSQALFTAEPVGDFPRFEAERGGSRQWTAETSQAVRAISPTSDHREDDFEALKAQALRNLKKEKQRSRAVVLRDPTSESGVIVHDVKRLKRHATHEIVEHVLAESRQYSGQEEDVELVLLRRVRDRLGAVGLEPPTITVRFRELTVMSKVSVSSRQLPTISAPVMTKLAPMLRALGSSRAAPRRPFTLLDAASGVLHPGRLTLLLGPPQSGKTTLLRTLAGLTRRVSALKVAAEELTYNGYALGEFVPERSLAYVSQIDTHFGELTVRETLEFSARVQSTGHRRALVEEVEAREQTAGITADPALAAYMRSMAMGGRRSVIAELVLRLLGLTEAADTVVGNAMLRGISGGQKKRVTLGESVVGPARALFADEISTGLDSARTYEVIKHLRNLTHIMKATVFCALLTPGPETTDLFDDILVLSAGKIVFYGPREHVMPFYAELGFELPPRLGLADFLQEVNTPMDQDRYWSSGRPYRYLTPRALHQAFRRTEASRRIEEELGSPFPRTQEAKAALAHQKYGSSSGALLRAVARRTWLLQRRTAVFAIIRTFQVVLMAFILSSAFWRESRQTVDDGNYFLGVIFYSVLYQLLGGTSEMHLVVERLPVVHRQEANRFYPGWAFAAPTFLLRLPYSLLESALWSVLVYWIVGFDPSAGHFFMFWLLLFLINAWSIVFFQLVASVARDDTIATAIGSAFLLIFINLNGFVINAADVPPWWLWGLWPNPYFWATRALAINEFTSSNWEQPNPTNPANSLGLDVLDFRGFPSAYWWTWAAVGFIIASGAFIFLLFVVAMTFLGAKRSRMVLTEETVREADAANRSLSSGPPTTVERLSARNTDGNQVAENYVDVEAGAASDGMLSGGSLESAGYGRLPSSRTVFSGPVAVTAAPYGNGAAPAILEHDGQNLPQNTPGRHVQGYASEASPVASPRTASFDVVRGENPSFVLTERSAGSSLVSPRARSMAAAERCAFATQAAEAYRQRTAIPFPALSLTFRNIEYSVPLPKKAEVDPKSVPQEGLHAGKLRLLKGISGVFRPHVLTALMGASGAGKTTLMDCLAGRKTSGNLTGDIRLNGHPKDAQTFARISGYVEQQDVHLPQASVREALAFSARLRLPMDVEASQRDTFVEEVLQLVELDRIAGAHVGVPGESGLSVEQRKRLTLAVELVANPSIVFLDEPTSGLDSRSASIVVAAIRNTVDTGRTVVCTVHQPSITVFEAFDELLLLVAGGRTAYFGPLGDGAERLVDHLQSIPKVIPIRPRANPATWMLEVTASAAEEAMHVDFAEAYASSDLAREMDRVIAQHEQPAPGSQPLQLAHLGVAPWNVQFNANFRRFWLQYWRAPEYNLTRLIVTIGVALVFGSLFWDQGNDVSDAAGVLNVAGVIFSSVLFIGITDCLTVQHLAASQRAVMYRERAAGYYSEASFAIAQIAVEWPYLFFQTLLYSSNAYFMIGFAAEAGKFFSFVLFFFLTLCYFTCFGQAAVALTPSVALSNVLCSFFFGFWNLFCGFLKPEPALPPYWQWFYYLNPVSWSLSSLSISQLGDLDDTQLTDFEGKTVTVPQFLEERFNWQEALLWPTVAILLAFFVVFAFVNVFALRNINYQRR